MINFKNKKIFFHIATIPERKEALKKTIKSIETQCDKIYLALNFYSKIPSWIKKNKKIFAYIRKNKKGCGERFYKIGKLKNHIAFIADDDIIYPKKYVKKSLEYLRVYGKNSVLSYHGRRLKKLPIKSYYKDSKKIYHFLFKLNKIIEVDTIGVGVSFFDTTYFKIQYKDIKIPNSDDICVAYFAKKGGTKVLVIPHDKNWFNYQNKMVKNTISKTYRNNDFVQTNFINQNFKDFFIKETFIEKIYFKLVRPIETMISFKLLSFFRKIKNSLIQKITFYD
jgi:hypothetical protein